MLRRTRQSSLARSYQSMFPFPPFLSICFKTLQQTRQKLKKCGFLTIFWPFFWIFSTFSGFTFNNDCGELESAWSIFDGSVQDAIFDSLVYAVAGQSEHSKGGSNSDGQRSLYKNGHLPKTRQVEPWHSQVVPTVATECGVAGSDRIKPVSKSSKQNRGTWPRKSCFEKRHAFCQWNTWFSGIFFLECEIIDRFSQISDFILEWKFLWNARNKGDLL